ncbi:hypothetical protein BSL78_10060 [Apostichopus japonicus]|uniref:Transmembrane protein n=1 Tax=Stichopus japonicus TaxID=307972 RepID=A0A2G8KYE4_STIJA|nr:hypothetical protein BSL78_10060 [Apostichopus japonicus]
MADSNPENEEGANEENDIEISVQISDVANTLDNRYSVVILDVKGKEGDVGKKTITENRKLRPTPEKPETKVDERDLTENVSTKDTNKNRKSSIPVERYNKNRKSSIPVECQTVNGSPLMKTPQANWRNKLDVSRIRCIYINLCVWISLHIITTLTNYLVFDATQQNTALILLTLLISLLVYLDVWVYFQLRITILHKWFKIAVGLSWGSFFAFLLYLIVILGELISKKTHWTFIKLISASCVTGTTGGLLVTSLVGIFHLTSIALANTDKASHQSTDVESSDVQDDQNKHGQDGQNKHGQDGQNKHGQLLDCKAVFRCSIVLFLSCCFSLPISIGLAIRPCSVLWLFAISMTTLLLVLVIVGIKNHMSDEKTEFLWHATLWIPVLSSVVVVLTLIVTIIDLSRLGRCERLRIVSALLDLSLMGLVFINAVVLLKIIVVTTQPLRDHGDPTGEDITSANNSTGETKMNAQGGQNEDAEGKKDSPEK